jgi:hypothetical protein
MKRTFKAKSVKFPPASCSAVDAGENCLPKRKWQPKSKRKVNVLNLSDKVKM